MRSVRYAIRLPANDVLERAVEDLLVRPRGRPSYAPLVRYRSFQYQAAGTGHGSPTIRAPISTVRPDWSRMR